MQLDSQTLLNAYAKGIFPMSDSADDPEIFWVQPKERGIIPLDDFHVPSKLAKTIRQRRFEIRINHAFPEIMRACAQATGDRPSTWINGIIFNAYCELHRIGHCHSVEAWSENKLVGGLYGVTLGGVFFGESMFSRQPDASKVCLVILVERLRARGFKLLDTQFTTDHLKRFGAVDVTGKEYKKLLAAAIIGSAKFYP